MPTRSANTAWNGDLQSGAGKVELVSSGLARYDVSFPKRSAEKAESATSPEELIAAAHSSCYAMQFSAFLAEAGASIDKLDVTADVSLGEDPQGGFKLTGIALRVVGKVSGIDQGVFTEKAEQAKAECPVSKALAGVDITLDASLDS